MKHIEDFNGFVNEEFKPSDISNFFKLISLRKSLRHLDWDDNDYIRKLFHNIYPLEELDDDIKYLSIDNMIDILYKIKNLNFVPELYYDKKEKKVKIKTDK